MGLKEPKHQCQPPLSQPKSRDRFSPRTSSPVTASIAPWRLWLQPPLVNVESNPRGWEERKLITNCGGMAALCGFIAQVFKKLTTIIKLPGNV